MPVNELKSLVIVGGGTAGWMAASAFAKVMGPKVKITLVESDMIGTIGVGEATIPAIKIFNDILKIDEDDFLTATNGTFKLGIEFVNWKTKDHSYFHDFGIIGKDLAYIDFHHYWLDRYLNGNRESLWDYSINNIAAKNNKFSRMEKIPNTPLEGLVHAFHFDANLYAKYLRNIAEKMGVTRIEGKVLEVELNNENGNIDSIKLENGDCVNGDFFIDCTGFAALLIEKSLGVKYIDYSSILPMNRALAIPCESAKPIRPYTRSIAHNAGWQWRIPLQNRTGNGHVFCSEFISEDEALNILLNNIDGKPLSDPKLIKFTTGRREKIWKKNCVAIGLSSGFLEPLESTSIHLIQSAIIKLIALFPHNCDNQFLRDEFNNQITKEFDYVRDFIFLHYFANERYGEKFWDMMRNIKPSNELRHKIELFKESGVIYSYQYDLFQLPSWLQVMIGQGIMPKAAHPFVKTINPKDLDGYMGDIKNIMNSTVNAMPSHEAFIARNCPMRRV